MRASATLRTQPASTLIVIAKAPVAGRVKTRMCPPLTYAEAAHVAGAALVDTLGAALRSRARRVAIALDGDLGECPRDVHVLLQEHRGRCSVFRQRGEGLAARIANAFDDVGDAAALIGMDTPQVSPTTLNLALGNLRTHDAVLGLSDDGGYWLIGLNDPHASVFDGVAMSTSSTGSDQHERLLMRGLRVGLLPTLIDVDDIASGSYVARSAPDSAFARALRSVQRAEHIASRQ